jgi:hypothetical protein
MKKFYRLILVVMATALLNNAKAQLPNVLYVAPGETMYVSVADTLYTFGLSLTPSTRLDLSGISIYRNPTLANNTLNNAISRAFTFTPTAPAFRGVYKFWYNESELNGNSETPLQLYYHTSLWSTVPKATHDTILNLVTSDTVNINPIELTLAPFAVPLPVTWLQLAAGFRGKEVAVTWKTAAESNLQGYTVLHSINGSNWMPIGTVPPKGAAENNYELLHRNPAVGKNFYKIQSLELAGASKYSKVVTVNVGENNQLSVYPNPTRRQQSAVLYIGKPALVQIFTINGALLSANYYVAGTHKISTDGIAPGTYLINDGQQVMKWVIQ